MALLHQSNINNKTTTLACLACLHGVLLLCTWLANDRPLSSSQAVWAEYELMHCNMTVIIPLGEPAVLQGSFKLFSWVQGFPTSSLSLSFSYHLSHLPLLLSPLLPLPFLSFPFSSYATHIQATHLSLSALQCNFCSLLPGPSVDGNP